MLRERKGGRKRGIGERKGRKGGERGAVERREERVSRKERKHR